MTTNEFRANLCAGMIPNICKRLDNHCELAKTETSTKEWGKIREKARHDLKHLCECLKAITTDQAIKLSPIYRTASDRYAATFM